MQYCRPGTHKASGSRVWLYDQLAAMGWTLGKMVPLAIDDVVKHWATSPQNDWSEKDWPNPVPPRSRLFVESDFPAFIVDENRQAQLLDAGPELRFGFGCMEFPASDRKWMAMLPGLSRKLRRTIHDHIERSSRVMLANLFTNAQVVPCSFGVMSIWFQAATGRVTRLNMGQGLGQSDESAYSADETVNRLADLIFLAFASVQDGRANLTSDANGRLHISMQPAYRSN